MNRFPIGVLAELTSMSTSTLRAWERRYGVPRSIRTQGGHRLYTAADVATVNRLNALRREGLSLRAAVHVLRSGKEPLPPESAVLNEALQLGGDDIWVGYHHYVVQAIRRFSLVELDACYTTLLALYSPQLVASRLLIPVLRTLGDRWDTHPGGIAEEHFFAAYVRNRLGGWLQHEYRSARGPQLVLTCLPGELHELGLLHFAIVLLTHGMRPLYLGPNLPFAEVAPIMRHVDCTAVVLSGTVVVPNTDLRAGLAALAKDVDVPVLVGGAVADRYADDLKRCGVIPSGSHYGKALDFIDNL